MKKNRKWRIRLLFSACLTWVFVGCGRDDIVFVDSIEGYTTEEMISVSEESAATDDRRISGEDNLQVVEIWVHVCGEVISPGVYKLAAGSRVIDAVEMAGGLADTAGEEGINLAGAVSDGMQIYIPTREEALVLKSPEADRDGLSGKVNINTADKTLLCTLPGIGEVRAESIIAYRNEYGAFGTIEDIMQVSGIKDSSFQKIKDFIVVN